MKNIISIVFAVAILACSLCACGGNTEPETTAAPVETTAGTLTSAELEYVLLEDGTVKITAYKGNGLDEAGESLKTYTIPDEIDGKKVTVIASGAFKDAFRVEGNDLGTAVTFPRNIVTVEDHLLQLIDLTSLVVLVYILLVILQQSLLLLPLEHFHLCTIYIFLIYMFRFLL